MADKFNLDGFSVDDDNVCTAEGGFVGNISGSFTQYSYDPAGDTITTSDDSVALIVSILGFDLTLDDGKTGQRFTIVRNGYGSGTVTITPDTFNDGTSISMEIDEYVDMIYIGGWQVLSGTGTVVSES